MTDEGDYEANSDVDGIEVDDPAVAEGIFFRQGLQFLAAEDFQSAFSCFNRIAHSQHFSPYFYLGVAAMHLEDLKLEAGLLPMLQGLEMMLARAKGELKHSDPNLLIGFSQEIQRAVRGNRLEWKNEDFEIEASFDELQALVQETKQQIEKGNIDHGLITELCCTIIEIVKQQSAHEA